MTGTVQQQAMALWQRADRLFSLAEMDASLAGMAAAMNQRLADRVPLLLCAMNGAVVTVGRLLPMLDFPLELDSLHVTRYGQAAAGGELQVRAWPMTPIQGRHVIIVDDILDKGRTLDAMLHHCRSLGALTISIAVMVDKQCRREVEIRPDYVGVAAPDRFLVGYGLDYKGFMRNAPGLFALPAV